MGVDRTDYLIYGYKFNYKELKTAIPDFYDRAENYIHGTPEVENKIVVIDGMSSGYIIIGWKLASLNQYDDELFSFSNADLKKFRREAKNNWIRELLGDYFDPTTKPTLLYFSHYS